MWPAVAILYLIGLVLGGWCISLFWRYTYWRIGRGCGRGMPSLPARVRQAAIWGGVSGPLLIVASVALGEWVRTGFSFAFVEDAAFYHGVAVIGCVVFGASATVGGWRFDPAHGRRRCRGCWYDMRGVQSRQCPECGRIAASERALLRTRRSFGLMAAGSVLLVGAYAVYFTPHVRRDGWRAAIPTTVLIAGMPWWPRDMVSGGSNADLSSRKLKYEWQRQFLQWRSRRTVERSQDAETVLRAMQFLKVDASNTGSERLREALSRWLVMYCDADDRKAVEAEPIAEQVRYFWPRIHFSEGICTKLAPTAAEAMDSKHEDRVSRGLEVMALMPHGQALLLPRLRPIMEKFPARAELAIWLLAKAASENRAAFQEYLPLLEHTDLKIRLIAIVESDVIPESNDIERSLLTCAYDDDDRIAGAAASRWMRRVPYPCEHADEFCRRAAASMEFASRVLETIAKKCSCERAAEVVKALLASPKSSVRAQAAGLCDGLWECGDVMLPLLREAKDIQPESPYDRLGVGMIDEAIRRLEADQLPRD